VAVVAEDGVSARPAGDRIIAKTGVNEVAAGRAVDGVVGVAGGDGVVPAASVNVVGAVGGLDPVVSFAAEDRALKQAAAEPALQEMGSAVAEDLAVVGGEVIGKLTSLDQHRPTAGVKVQAVLEIPRIDLIAVASRVDDVDLDEVVALPQRPVVVL